MKESLTDWKNEETFAQDLPDAALEAAAGKYWEVGNPFTIAFCELRNPLTQVITLANIRFSRP
jgi:hypothetical protein